LVAGIGLPGSADSATLEEIQNRGYLIAVTEDSFPPFEFVKDGKPLGFDHALAELFKAYVPFEVRQEIIPWQGLLAGVATGKFDLALTAASITDERAESLDFSMPIAEGTYYFVKRKGDDRIAKEQDLSGLSVAVTLGSAMGAFLPVLGEQLAQNGGKLGRVATYASYPEAYQDLANGRVDYVVNSVVGLADLVRQKPETFELGSALSERSYHAWAVAKGNVTLLQIVNEFLSEQRKNGTLAKLQAKWLGQPFSDLPMEPLLPGDRKIPN
jgi:polar amino acid transport system substrate-binding protein